MASVPANVSDRVDTRAAASPPCFRLPSRRCLVGEENIVGSIFKDADRSPSCRRIESLTSDLAPRWGKMDAKSMLAHLKLSALMALGELEVADKGKRVFQVFPLKHLILYVAPFPKSAPTAPELLPPEANESFAVLRSELVSLMDRIGTGPREGKAPVHPLLGQIGRANV